MKTAKEREKEIREREGEVRADGFVYRGGQWVSPETARKEDLEKSNELKSRGVESLIISSIQNTEKVADMLTGKELMDALMSNSNGAEQKLAAFAELVHRLQAPEMEKDKKIENTPKALGNADVFGGCPINVERDGILGVCGKNDMVLHVERSEYCICKKHRTFWFIGSNLMSSWREMTDEEFKQNDELLKSYRPVEPVIMTVITETEPASITADDTPF